MYSSGDLKIHSISLHSHVKTVKCFANYVFYGIGNRIHCYNWKRKAFLQTEIVFNSTNYIHGIKIFAEGNDVKILCFGGKAFRLYSFNENISKNIFKPLTDECYLEDWIHDVAILGGFNEEKTALFITAHNSVIFWDFNAAAISKQYHCLDKCILYCACFLSSSRNSIIIAAGTVFKEILVWSPDLICDEATKECKPFHKLIGHQGVLFSITYNSALKLLCSTSDDRSLRLWRFLAPEKKRACDTELEIWCQGTFQFVHVLYAHESRVWSSAILHSCIISVGEDSSVCFWKHDGSLLRREQCHNGGSIWCIDTNYEGTLAVTGGSDSGVLLWDVENITSSAAVKIISLDSNFSCIVDFPRNVLLVVRGNHHFMLVSTDKGRILLYDLQQKSWVFEYCDDSFCSYCMPSISPDNNLIFIGNLLGEVFIFTFDEDVLSFSRKVKICNDKINSIHWLEPSCEFVLICGLKGKLMLWEINLQAKAVELTLKCQFHLPENKHHWWSSAAVLLRHMDMLVVGDRAGGIHLYADFSEKSETATVIQTCFSIQPISSDPYAHGKSGVTHLRMKDRLIYSTGRDGKLIAYKISTKKLHRLHHVKVPYDMEWLAKMMVIQDDLVLLGFHAKDFVAWSTKHGRLLMKVSCGGGHRSWDFAMVDDFSATFAAVKKKEIFIATTDLNSIINGPVVLMGSFGMPLRCICFIIRLNDKIERGMSILACGGEDPTLKIVGLKDSGMLDSSSPLIVLQSLSGHLSNIRAIAKCPLSDQDFLMVSVGGRAQICAWKVSCYEDVICEYLGTDFLWNSDKPLRKPWKEKHKQVPDPLTRYMDVAVWARSFNDYLIGTACSDSFVRVHSFDMVTNVFLLLSILPQGENCVLKLSLLNNQKGLGPFLISAATNGYLKVHDLSSTNGIVDHTEVDSDSTITTIAKKRVHQSGVNALDVKLISDGSWLICTGGDDNAISMTLWHYDQYSDAHEMAFGTEENAHASQIAGIRILPNEMIMSVSIDQRLNLWQWEQCADTIKIRLYKSQVTYVADVSDLEMFFNDSTQDWTAIVCGEGIEEFTIKHDG